MKRRVAFDLDETLGVPAVEESSIVGFLTRDGAIELLGRLKRDNTLLLWTVSKRSYAEKALSFGLNQFFDEIYTRDEIETNWKDMRKIKADYLIDDSDYHRGEAVKHGIEKGYIVVAADSMSAHARLTER